MAENLIEFFCPDGAQGQIPRPVPASQGVPEWVKQMPNETGEAPGNRPWMTVKKCPPFVDALTGGYLIPLAGDIQFIMEKDGLNFRAELPIIETHPQDQIRGTPFEGRVIVKFMNFWIIKTPPGYSCLFVQPLNRGLEFPFQVISGIVETDTYYREINFPSLCLMRPGTSVVVRKGTPLVQIFPFRRETWKSGFGQIDPKFRKTMEDEFQGTIGHYKSDYWRRKEFE